MAIPVQIRNLDYFFQSLNLKQIKNDSAVWTAELYSTWETIQM